MFTRRTFLAAAGAAPWLAERGLGRTPARKKIAIISTVWTYLSHSQHMGDRFLVGYPSATGGGTSRRSTWSRSTSTKSPRAISACPASLGPWLHGLSDHRRGLCAAAGDKLAVDGVVIIAEHGNYPRNKKGQILYPRYEFFQQAIEVFEKDGAAQSRSTTTNICRSSGAEGREDGRGPRNGSISPSSQAHHLPVTWRLPPVEVPYDANLEEAADGWRRRLRPHGLPRPRSDAVAWSNAAKAERFRDQIRPTSRSETPSAKRGRRGGLVSSSARGRSPAKRLAAGRLLRDSRPQDLVHNGALPGLRLQSSRLPDRAATTAFAPRRSCSMGHSKITPFAARLQGGQILSTQFFLSPSRTSPTPARLVAQIEDMIMTGQALLPRRANLRSPSAAMLDRLLDPKVEGHRRIETP